jgi:hypothetical protein
MKNTSDPLGLRMAALNLAISDAIHRRPGKLPATPPDLAELLAAIKSDPKGKNLSIASRWTELSRLMEDGRGELIQHAKDLVNLAGKVRRCFPSLGEAAIKCAEETISILVCFDAKYPS